MRTLQFLLLAVTVVSAGAVCLADGSMIRGAVKDQNNNAVTGITVIVINTKKEKLFDTTTDKDGKYEIQDVTPGLYTVKAMPPLETKLARQESQYVNVLNGRPSEVNFSLRAYREETFVLPKGTGLLMVQLAVGNDKTTNKTTTEIHMHYPVGNDQGEAEEGLLWFDLSSLPEGAEVASAKLSLFCTRHDTLRSIISMHRVLVKWNEKANWVTYDGTNEWHRPGGTGKKDIHAGFDESGAAEVSSDNSNKFVDFDITGMVQKWVNKEVPNYGMKSMTTKVTSAICFSSSTYGATDFVKLTVVIAK